jgi:hypothetical protein
MALAPVLSGETPSGADGKTVGGTKTALCAVRV